MNLENRHLELNKIKRKISDLKVSMKHHERMYHEKELKVTALKHQLEKMLLEHPYLNQYMRKKDGC